MIIDLIKHSEIFKGLEQYNEKVFMVCEKIKNLWTDETGVNRLSPWFYPEKIKINPPSRTYPETVSEQLMKEYCLALSVGNYLSLFLVNYLYNDRKDILIEDFGGGLGIWFYYLHKLGFHNFNLADNFSQLPESSTRFFSKEVGVDFKINFNETAVITNNCGGVPWYINSKVGDNTELVICYTNDGVLKKCSEELPAKGFRFLCQDIHYFTVAYCRNEKYNEFSKRLEGFTK